MKDTTLPSDNPLNLERTYYKTTFSDIIKTIDNKIEQNKCQFDLDKQTAKISACCSPENIGKYKLKITSAKNLFFAIK